ncbi:acyl-CoA dehydrogenase family protein [Paraburkholderia sp. CNPSo 3274]|uniref:acyl-CoA dehydrogenase family protein n=1 Tax=Paraburkholderia sp. CNPSo 3274 TaxID=2940932 RepID=UPI0020B7C976|nr:acyl-CoA dehydrogenase family protein [Paraburkholderia sp. CNPSo 3274]MCP3707018.1 acyl-CoA dehydrogenase family protein [Paraburkholderia sp. CNPSo 3274]
MIRDAARLNSLLTELYRFVQDECIPLEAEIDRTDVLPETLVARMRELGLFGHSIAQAYGGAGLTTEELACVNMVVSQAAPTFRARFGGNTGIGSEALIADGTEEQKQRYLRRLASGEITGCFALTEPDAGSDATALATTARREGDGYVLDGSKRYITNAPIADLFTVFARTNPDDPGAGGISAFLIERGTPGLTTSAGYRMMGQRGSPVGEVHLHNCRVSASAVLGGEPGRGFKSAMQALNKQRINLAGLCVGPAIRLLDEMLAYAKAREQFGKPIAEFQLVQQFIAQSNTDIHAARALVLQTARARDRGEDVTMSASMCKLFASEMCGRVADRAVQVYGGGGFIADNSVERLYRDVRLFRLYEGTSQIHELNIAKLTLRAPLHDARCHQMHQSAE